MRPLAQRVRRHFFCRFCYPVMTAVGKGFARSNISKFLLQNAHPVFFAKYFKQYEKKLFTRAFSISVQHFFKNDLI